MQRDDLVPQDILPRCYIRRNRDGPCVVVGNESVSRPGTRVASRQQADSVDFEPSQRRFIDRRTGPITRGEIVDDGPVVGGGPGGPFEGQD